jgi:hypothetical protein
MSKGGVWWRTRGFHSEANREESSKRVKDSVRRGCNYIWEGQVGNSYYGYSTYNWLLLFLWNVSVHACLYEAFIVWKFEQLYGLNPKPSTGAGV